MNNTIVDKKGKSFYLHSSSPLFISKMLKEENIDVVKKEIDEIQLDFSKAKSYNDKLAGHLQRQFLLSDNSKECLQKVIEPTMNDFILRNPLMLDTIVNLTRNKWTGFYFEKPWVNFQQKYEFNPLHNHTGIFSYVLYIKIPYYIKDEESVFPDTFANRTGKFEFSYPGVNENIVTQILPIDKTCENLLLFFPSKLYHCVHPFYSSDEYRISVAGNIFLEFEK